MSEGKSQKFVYKNLSYKIIGVLFDVFNELGYGYQEKYYQRAIAIESENRGIKFKKEFFSPIRFKQIAIGKYYFDFLVEDKIILEIKKGNEFRKKDIEQVFAYLRKINLKLGIIANFTKNGVLIKRIINLYP